MITPQAIRPRPRPPGPFGSRRPARARPGSRRRRRAQCGWSVVQAHPWKNGRTTSIVARRIGETWRFGMSPAWLVAAVLLSGWVEVGSGRFERRLALADRVDVDGVLTGRQIRERRRHFHTLGRILKRRPRRRACRARPSPRRVRSRRRRRERTRISTVRTRSGSLRAPRLEAPRLALQRGKIVGALSVSL